MSNFKFKKGDRVRFVHHKSKDCHECGHYIGSDEEELEGVIESRSMEALMKMNAVHVDNPEEKPDGSVVYKPEIPEFKVENYGEKKDPCYVVIAGEVQHFVHEALLTLVQL